MQCLCPHCISIISWSFALLRYLLSSSACARQQNKGLCCVATCSAVMILQSLTLHICCLLTTNRSNSILCWPLLYDILWFFHFLNFFPLTASQFLITNSISSRPSRFLVPNPNHPTESSSPITAIPKCPLKYSAIHVITCASTNPIILSSSSLKAFFSDSALPV